MSVTCVQCALCMCVLHDFVHGRCTHVCTCLQGACVKVRTCVCMHVCIHALQGAYMHDSSISFAYVYIHMT